MEREERGMDLGIDGLGLKQIVMIIGLTFAITLAVMIGKRMSAEAMAVVIGIACGVLASVPASLLLLLVLGRGGSQTRGSQGEVDRRGYPPVVIVQGGAPQALPSSMAADYWPSATPPLRREFQLVDALHELSDRGETWR